MLRKIRLTLATVFFVFITLLFLDFTGTIHSWFGWMAKVQFLPALLGVNLVVILLLLLLTFVFGRIYCSVICPLGVFQDIIAWIGKRFKRNPKIPYEYSPAKSGLRYGILAVFVIALFSGFNVLVSLLAPYSSYGRIASSIFQPIYRWINNIFAQIAEHYESYLFYETDIWLKSISTLLISIATLLIIGYLAFKNGRTYCNTICPVGSTLGFLSRFSIFKIRMNEDKCTQCSICSKNCKTAAINFKTLTIDYSRCVVCGNCLTKCNFDAIKYQPSIPNFKNAFPGKQEEIDLRARHKSTKNAQKETNLQNSNIDSIQSDNNEISMESNNERIILPNTTSEPNLKSDSTNESLRAFISTITIGAAATVLRAQEAKVDGGLADIIDKQQPNRQQYITPPGSISIRNLSTHCTGCQLCISACPNHVLRPSTSLSRLMQPEMSYEQGYCRPECIECSSVCPTGAIKPITIEDKSSTQIGHAVFIKKNCVVINDEVECGNCSRHCPTGAIEMVPLDEKDLDSPLIPAVNESRCIGCGTCENLCPARPFSAIYVEGHQVHHLI